MNLIRVQQDFNFPGKKLRKFVRFICVETKHRNYNKQFFPDNFFSFLILCILVMSQISKILFFSFFITKKLIFQEINVNYDFFLTLITLTVHLSIYFEIQNKYTEGLDNPNTG